MGLQEKLAGWLARPKNRPYFKASAREAWMVKRAENPLMSKTSFTCGCNAAKEITPPAAFIFFTANKRERSPALLIKSREAQSSTNFFSPLSMTPVKACSTAGALVASTLP